MRILLYRHLEPAFSSHWLSDAAGPLPRADQLAPFVTEILHAPRQLSRTVNWSSDPGDAEAFHSIPLWGRNQNLLAILLVGNSRRELANLTAFIRWMALAVGTGGILLGLLVSGWMSYRITQPLQDLSQGARAVASGDWSVKVKAKSRDEIGQLTLSFNEMTRQLVEQRERLIQVERVAAWRELARRLAHELKNPLFPLQITIENLQRAKNEHPEQFDEVFQESTGTLLVELSNLKDIINRFSEFARMPPPRFELTRLHEVVDQVLKLYEARFVMPGQPPVRVARDFDPQIPVISADPEQLSRALQNLVLNALDAMPQGGNLSLRTSSRTGGVRLEIIDSGSGLTKEECTRLFTPYYTTKRLGTGLGLAIVQSVVSDHGGTIVVESAPGQGTTFRIDLPEKSG
jgi:nitrogen fixation/metabolism regulation signal transduction histidine kinase